MSNIYDSSIIPEGESGATAFHKAVEELLLTLFAENLVKIDNRKASENNQYDTLFRVRGESSVPKSDDELPIDEQNEPKAPVSEFWNFIIERFNCGYFVLECKNNGKSSKKKDNRIKENDVLVTEKYLYPKALRPFCIMACRNGQTEKAVETARQALREHGKLILFLNEPDFEMLNEIYNGTSAIDQSQFMFEKLDAFLQTCGR